MKKISIALLSFAAFFSVNAQARDFADIYTECGLGAMIAPNNDAVAAVTNVTWDLGTTAISSNASSEESCKGGKVVAAALIHQTLPSLERELAVGTGENLDALITVTGCSAEFKGQMIDTLRADLSTMTAKSTYLSMSRFEKAEHLFNTLNTETSQTCS